PGADTGAVFFFDAATGTLVRTLQNPDGGADDFGSGLALVGSHLIVGASGDSLVGDDRGVVHVFDLATLTLEQTIPSPTPDDESFGFTVVAVGNGFVANGFGAPNAYLYSTDVCGNGTVGPFEQCDDNNLTSGDGCDADCTFTGCGNRIVTTGEQCDD